MAFLASSSGAYIQLDRRLIIMQINPEYVISLKLLVLLAIPVTQFERSV